MTTPILRPLADIKRDVEAATPGPWRSVCRSEGRGDQEWIVETAGFRDGTVLLERDARFIAYARTDVPALVARVEALEQAAENVQWARNIWRGQADVARARIVELEAENAQLLHEQRQVGQTHRVVALAVSILLHHLDPGWERTSPHAATALREWIRAMPASPTQT